MQSFDKYNEFHDWEVNAIRLSGRELELCVAFKDARKVIRFKGVSRCRLDDFVVQNVIHDVKIIDETTSPEIYAQERQSLPRLPHSGSSDHQRLAKMTSSVGVDGVIEFEEVSVEDVS